MSQNKIRQWIENKPVFILLPLWLLVQSYLTFRFGIHHHFDSYRYIAYADQFLETGRFPYVHEFWYLGYALYLAFFRMFTHNEFFVIAGQVLFSGAATWALYQISLKLSQSRIAAFVAALFFILWIKGQWWNYFVLTESLFTSCNILLFYFLLKRNQSISNNPSKPLIFSPNRLLVLFPLLLFTFFIRPVGIITVLTFILFLFADFLEHKQVSKKQILYGVPIFLLIASIAVLLLNKITDNYWLITAFARGEIICSVFECSLVNDLNLPESEGSMLRQTAYFIQHNFAFFVEMCCRRMLAFWGGLRTTFSFGHNLLTALFLFPIYVLAMVGLLFRFSLSAKVHLVAFILGNSLMILITCVNFDGRFISPVLPFVFILAGIGLARVIRWR